MDTNYQDFRPGATPEEVMKSIRHRESRVLNTAYVNEVAAHLKDMKVGECRIIPNCPRTLRKSNLCNMLEWRGWYISRHYVTGILTHDIMTGLKYPAKNRPRFFVKTEDSLSAKTLTDVD